MSGPVDLASIHITALRCQQEGIGLSECALRRLVKMGDIPSVHIGSKSLVSWPILMRFVQCGNGAAPAVQSGAIRRVEG